MEDILRSTLQFLVPAVEACGALVIALAVVRTIIQYVRNFFRRRPADVTPLRIRLGQSMVMALEFQVAADILKTALQPEWNDVLLLAALIGLRTALNYILERELRMLKPNDTSCD